jgi:mono/diheme cytochrome c family protein
MKSFLIPFIFASIIAVPSVTESFSQPKSQPALPPEAEAREGETIFQKMCAACHTIGGGKRIGPDLKDVTEKRNRDWLVGIIIAPDKMFNEGDPIASQLLKEYGVPMPNLNLSEAQAHALIAYLGGQAGFQAALPPEAVTAAGDPFMGNELFTGAITFQKGGPACIACHNISDAGFLGGGTLGPDLTQAYKKYGDKGLLSVLQTSPFPTMKPIYGTRPLTVAEQAHLKSFFQTMVVQEPSSSAGRLVLIALGGFLVLNVLFHLIWRSRLAAIRRPLVEEAMKRGSMR